MTNCTFSIISAKEEAIIEYDNNNNMTTPVVQVNCLPGSDGGKVQTFHLIGLLSSSISASLDLSNLRTDVPWMRSTSRNDENSYSYIFSNKSDPDREQPPQQLQSSIIELIQSIQSSNILQWNLSTNEVAQFVLVDATINQMYDLIIYADNQIGLSAPVIYQNLVLLTEQGK